MGYKYITSPMKYQVSFRAKQYIFSCVTCYGYIMNRAFRRKKKCLTEMVLYFIGV